MRAGRHAPHLQPRPKSRQGSAPRIEIAPARCGPPKCARLRYRSHRRRRRALSRPASRHCLGAGRFAARALGRRAQRYQDGGKRVVVERRLAGTRRQTACNRRRHVAPEPLPGLNHDRKRRISGVAKGRHICIQCCSPLAAAPAPRSELEAALLSGYPACSPARSRSRSPRQRPQVARLAQAARSWAEHRRSWTPAQRRTSLRLYPTIIGSCSQSRARVPCPGAPEPFYFERSGDGDRALGLG
jgi:hypothetical protein